MSSDQQVPYPEGQGFDEAPPPYGQPGYGNGYGYGPHPQAPPYSNAGYGYPKLPPTNTLAILSLVFAFVFAPAAIVLGAVARKQIRRTGERGSGLATSGFVLGIVFTVISVIWTVAVLVFIHSVLRDAPSN
jgi:hypothetical protein